MQPLQADASAEFSSIVVPNVVTAQLGYLLRTVLSNGHPTLVIGPTGTGKSVFIRQIIFQDLPQEVFKSIEIAFTAKTSANQTQGMVDAVIDKRRKGIFGPAFGCKQIVFVDDLSMPEVEEYGAQPPIEIIRQLIDNGGWYDLADKTFKTIIDTQVVAAMGPAIGGSNQITPRMIRHFSIIGVCEFGSSTLKTIYSAIMSWYCTSKDQIEEITDLSSAIVQATLEITQFRESVAPDTNEVSLHVQSERL